MSATRGFDVVVWGATGFTGRLAVEYLWNRQQHKQVQTQAHALRWAIAGRDESKLQQLRSELEQQQKQQQQPSSGSIATLPDVLVGDINDLASIEGVVRQARVVIAAVGPFALHGEAVVRAAIETGTDYVDITGETSWIYRMIDAYETKAVRAGCIMLPFAGFDSVPADLGSLYAIREFQRAHPDEGVDHVQSYVQIFNGGFSGGTAASVLNMIENPRLLQNSSDVHLLTPEPVGAARRTAIKPDETDQHFPWYSSVVSRLTVPFIMAVTNSRVVRRSFALYEMSGQAFGKRPSYNECLLPTDGWLTSIIAGSVGWISYMLGMGLLFIKPIRQLARAYVLPKPGQGPSADARAKSHFSYTLHVRGERGSTTAVRMRGAECYEDTAKFCVESALLLARDRERVVAQIKARGSNAPTSGFLTPSYALGDLLLDKLREAGNTFETL